MARKKDWVDSIFGKTTKTEKKVIKGVTYGIGVLALVGATGSVLKNLKK